MPRNKISRDRNIATPSSKSFNGNVPGSLPGGYAQYPAYGENAAKTARRLRQRGRAYSQDAEWRLARTAWQHVAQADPNDWEAQFRLCEACFWMEDWAACTLHGERARALRPGDPGVTLYIGRAFARLGDFGSAQPVWQRLVDADSNHYEGWFRLAQSQAQRGAAEEACTSLQRAIALDPVNPGAYPIIDLVLRGHARERAQSLLIRWLEQIESARAGAAEEVFKHLSRRWQGMARKALAQVRAGTARLSQGSPGKTAGIDTAQGNPPVDAAALLSEARRLHANRRWDEACEAWRRHLAAVPTHFESRLRLGETLMVLQRPHEAVGHLAEAHRGNPEHVRSFSRYAQCIAATGRRTEAIELWRARVAHQGTNPAWQLPYATFLAENGEEARARDVAVEALVSNRRPDRNTVALVRLLTRLGDFEAVASSLRKICRRDSAMLNDEIRAELVVRYACALESLGQGREALGWLQWADEAKVCHRLVVRNLIRMLGRFDQIDLAQSVVERMLQRAGPKLWAWQVAVDAMVSFGRYDDAQKYFARACDELELGLPDWLDLAERITIPDTRADVLSRIRVASSDDASLLERLSMVSFRHGDIRLALDFALRASSAAAHQSTAHKALAEIAYYNAEFERHGFAVDDVIFPDSAFEMICRHILDNPRSAEPGSDTVVMCNSSLAAGGAERQIAMTLRGLSRVADADFDLHIICRDLSPVEGKDAHLELIRNCGVDVVDLSKMPAFQPEDLPSLSARERRLLRLFEPKLRADLIQHYVEFVRLRPAVVHLWQDRTNLIGAVAAALAGVPRIVLSARSTRPIARQRFRPYMLRAYRAIQPLPGVVLCNNSRSGAADYAAWLHWPASSIEVVHNGFDFDELITETDIEQAEANRESLGIGPDDQLVGGVYRIAAVKRPLLWVETAALVCAQKPNVHFVIVGDGPLREEAELCASKHKIADRVHFVGHTRVGQWYPAMDALLLTSVTEGLPNVVIEAQAAGVPVVSTDVGGVREIIAEGRTGFAVSEATATELANRILRILSDSQWMESAKAEARRSARARFADNAMIARTLAVYRCSHAGHTADNFQTSTELRRESALARL